MGQRYEAWGCLMVPVEEARQNLIWAIRQVGADFKGEIEDGFCGPTAWLARFTRGDRACTVSVLVEWLDDCDPSKGYLPPALRNLLRCVVPDSLNEAR